MSQLPRENVKRVDEKPGTSLSDIGNRIAQLRKHKGISQADLARALVTKRSNIGMWESGERDFKSGTLLQIADYFDVTVDFLLCGREAENIDMYRATGLSQEAIETLKRYKRLDDGYGGKLKSAEFCEVLSIALSSHAFLSGVVRFLSIKPGEKGIDETAYYNDERKMYDCSFSPDMYAAAMAAHLSLILESLRVGKRGELMPYCKGLI